MNNMNNILDRINKEVVTNAQIINIEISGSLSIEDRINGIENSPEALKAKLRNELLLTRKLELEALLYDIAIELGYKVAK